MRKSLLIFLLTIFLLLNLSTWGEAALKRGFQDEEVKKIQVELLRRGYFITEVDGIFGPETELAIKFFQKHHELQDNGIVDVATYLTLFSRNNAQLGNFDYRARIIIDTAISMIGTPYYFGGQNRHRGIDCSSFTQQAFASAQIDIPRTADCQYEYGKKVSIKNVRPGDLLFYTTYEPGASHCGIYIGSGKFIHAGSSTGVTIADAFKGYWGKRFYGACRIL